MWQGLREIRIWGENERMFPPPANGGVGRIETSSGERVESARKESIRTNRAKYV